jgi:flavodoxin I
MQVKGDKFVGLALDEDNEDDKTEPRLDAWLAQLKTEMAM